MRDRDYKKIFIALLGLIIVIFVTFTISVFFDIPFVSKELWLGAIIIFISFYGIYTVPVNRKIVVGLICFCIMAVFFFKVLGWSIKLSLIVALIMIILLSSVFLIS